MNPEDQLTTQPAELQPTSQTPAEEPVPQTPPTRTRRSRKKPTAETGPETTSPADEPAEVRVQRVSLPDPHCQQTVSLRADKDGPRMRLGRSARKHRMEIHFDSEGKPNEEVRQTLKDEGWRFDSHDQVWVKPLERGAAWRSQFDAEKLFLAIANTIREQNGLAPVGLAGQAV